MTYFFVDVCPKGAGALGMTNFPGLLVSYSKTVQLIEKAKFIQKIEWFSFTGFYQTTSSAIIIYGKPETALKLKELVP
jgi:hypothetical protein